MNDIKDTAFDFYINKDNSCAETVIKSACAQFGIEMDESAVKAVGSFSGGCGVGDLCGAAAGALAAIGLKYGSGNVHGSEVQRDKMKQFMGIFKSEFGCTDCEVLKPQHKREDVRCFYVVEKTLELLSSIFDD